MLPLRALRRDEATRDRIAETAWSRDQLIQALFVTTESKGKEPVPGFPGVYRHGLESLLHEAEALLDAGIRKVLLFGVVPPSYKDETASWALRADGPVPTAVRELKRRFPELEVFTDVCVCGYTSHGHCGLVRGGEVRNDESVVLLARMAAVHGEAGADWVAPSAMMDGQVEAIRRALDGRGLSRVRILSYAAKYASRLYGPFREAAGSAPAFGDRRSYQMDVRNGAEAVVEVWADLVEGADAVMVKPALFYLDVIQRVRAAFPRVRLAAYLVSGEYAMLVRAEEEGSVPGAFREAVTAVFRAGADLLITYDTRRIASWEEDHG
ncbi:porphobilinogen synthase [Spirochaeta thermophila]|uniref:Delta-aminolevulinic acid dehydratase n=1 Tax=Winmispira thermophila (strain ATCC 49972 / DSM 6192 / RI 19.B1) TaxID=665571 RepID=E0RN84_WINT6|nr:porphobilinogen synthase [Spirochaeta thermophila]ADN02553.1 delta-aminolevulinic acid dehydratase [Spirochaeta thermophila DSM 6192]